MLAIITLPVDFATSMLGYVGELFTDLTPAIVVIVGLPVAFWAVGKTVSLIKGGFRSRR